MLLEPESEEEFWATTTDESKTIGRIVDATHVPANVPANKAIRDAGDRRDSTLRSLEKAMKPGFSPCKSKIISLLDSFWYGCDANSSWVNQKDRRPQEFRPRSKAAVTLVILCNLLPQFNLGGSQALPGDSNRAHGKSYV